MTLFLANANSFHIETWKKIYARLGQNEIDLATVHAVPATQDSFRSIVQVSVKSKIVAYALLGLRLRASPAISIHAHGASGYGLAARISGRPYIATIYGSEVLAAHGPLFRAMMRSILRNARAITVTSTVARDTIVRDFKVRPESIHVFHTGIDTDALDVMATPIAAAADSSPDIIFSMRNTAATYRTREIVEACVELSQRGRRIMLVVPLGNGDRAYFEDLRRAFAQEWIHYIDRRLENHEMLAWMKRANVCVSFPETDQMSTTILEALYVGHKVVAGRLEAYEELAAALGDNTSLELVSDGRLARAIEAALDGKEAESSARAIKTNYGIEQAARNHARILELLNG